jgi:hypothetical protein
MLCCELMGLGANDSEKGAGESITELEWQVALGTLGTRGRVESYLEKFPNPDKEMVKEKSWMQVCLYCKMLPNFDGMCAHMTEHWDEWKVWMNSRNAHLKRLPGEWEKKLTAFHKLVLLRCLCPEFGLVAVRRFVEVGLGKSFVGGEGGAADEEAGRMYDERSERGSEASAKRARTVNRPTPAPTTDACAGCQRQRPPPSPPPIPPPLLLRLASLVAGTRSIPTWTARRPACSS